jgi:GAF domain-containing protein
LANQVAVAIRNARLFEEVETALAEAHESQRLFMEQAWDRSSVVRQGSGRVQFSLGESTTLSETALAEARKQAVAQDEPTVVMINSEVADQPVDESITDLNRSSQYALVAPITLGDVTIGNLQLHDVDPHRQWTESDLAFINAIIDQVAQTAENLRLLSQTQERASRERLIGQVSDKLRRAPDLETLMKIATAEISRVLNPARTFVRFDTNVDDDNAGEAVSVSDNGQSDVEISQVEDNREDQQYP